MYNVLITLHGHGRCSVARGRWRRWLLSPICGVLLPLQIRRGRKGDRLDALLAKADSSKAWRTIYDEYNDEEITLRSELQSLCRWGTRRCSPAAMLCAAEGSPGSMRMGDRRCRRRGMGAHAPKR